MLSPFGNSVRGESHYPSQVKQDWFRLPADVSHRSAGLGLAKVEHDLLFGELLLFIAASSIPTNEGSRDRNLTSR